VDRGLERSALGLRCRDGRGPPLDQFSLARMIVMVQDNLLCKVKVFDDSSRAIKDVKSLRLFRPAL